MAPRSTGRLHGPASARSHRLPGGAHTTATPRFSGPSGMRSSATHWCARSLMAATVTAFATVARHAVRDRAPSRRSGRVVMVLCLFTIFWTSLLVRTYGWLLLYLPQGGAVRRRCTALGLRDEPLGIFQTDGRRIRRWSTSCCPTSCCPSTPRCARSTRPHPGRAGARRAAAADPLQGAAAAAARGDHLRGGAGLHHVARLLRHAALLSGPTNPTVADVIGGQFNVPGAAPVAAAMSLLLLP